MSDLEHGSRPRTWRELQRLLSGMSEGRRNVRRCGKGQPRSGPPKTAGEFSLPRTHNHATPRHANGHLFIASITLDTHDEQFNALCMQGLMCSCFVLPNSGVSPQMPRCVHAHKVVELLRTMHHTVHTSHSLRRHTYIILPTCTTFGALGAFVPSFLRMRSSIFSTRALRPVSFWSRASSSAEFFDVLRARAGWPSCWQGNRRADRPLGRTLRRSCSRTRTRRCWSGCGRRRSW